MRVRALALAAAIVWLAVPSSEAAARVSRVGMLWYGRSIEQRQPVIDAFKHGLGEQGYVAVLIPADGTYALHYARLAELAGRHGLPAIAGGTEYARSGGLMEFVPHEAESFRAVARYVARILKGANPGDLPIEQPTRFQLTLNLKTARTLGLTLPPAVLLRADAVIE